MEELLEQNHVEYSLIVPYRSGDSDAFEAVLQSYRHQYGRSRRDDYEIVVVESFDCAIHHSEHNKLIGLMLDFPDIPIGLCSMVDPNPNNMKYKMQMYGADRSNGRVLIHTGARVFHIFDVIRTIEQHFRKVVVPENWGPNHPEWRVPSRWNKYEDVYKDDVFIDIPCFFGFHNNPPNGSLFEKYEFDYQRMLENNVSLSKCFAILKSRYLKASSVAAEGADNDVDFGNNFGQRISVTTRLISIPDRRVIEIGENNGK
jgi:hypothetical protein